MSGFAAGPNSESRREWFVFMGRTAKKLEELETARAISLCAWRRRPQYRVILSEDIIVRGAGLVALVARSNGVLSRRRFQRIRVPETEVGPMTWLIFEAFRVLDRSLQAGELPHEVALAARRLL